jgi:hypothetical protein
MRDNDAWSVFGFPVFGFLFLVAVLSFLVTIAVKSNRADKEKADIEATKPAIKTDYGVKYTIEVVDGCQYLKSHTHNGWDVLTHKGNCTNKIHIYAVER